MKYILRCSQTLTLLMAFSVHAQQSFIDYDLTRYGNPTWGNGGSNFWVHRYWNPTLNRDECDYRGCQYNTVTHTGNDYPVNNPNYWNKVTSYGFGKVIGKKIPYGQISIRNLTNTGSYFQANLLHSSGISNLITEDKYIVKGQYIGEKNGIGANGTTSLARHLHFEISDTVSLAWIYTDDAHPGENGTNPSIYSKDGLNSNYGSSVNLKYYNPTVFASSKKESIPFLSQTASPSTNSYDVFGYSGQAIYGYLPLTGNYARSAILVRKSGNRELAEDSSSSASLSNTQKFVGDTAGLIAGSSISGTVANGYDTGDYLFLSYLTPTDESVNRYGYPVKFSIVNSGDIIVDNDQRNANSNATTAATYNGTEVPAANGNRVPGYYLTSDLFPGRSDSFAQWKPNSANTYKIYVHVPEYGASSTAVRYKIKPDGSTTILSKPVNQNTHKNQWVQLMAEDNSTTFEFNRLGMVGLSLGSTSADQNFSIPATEYVAFDAMKFERVESSNSSATTWSTGAYSDKQNISKILSIPGANSLNVTVSGETELSYDFLYILDSNNRQVKQLSGVINESFTVSGSSITAKFISDTSVTASGVTVTISNSVTSVSPSIAAIEKCFNKFSNYSNQNFFGQKVGSVYSCYGAYDCQDTSNPITKIAVEKNLTSNVFYYYYGNGWNYLDLQYCN